MVGGEIYVKKIPSMKVVDIAKAVNQNAYQEIVGIRPGEKIHEQMISQEDAPFTYEYPGYYKILPAMNGWHKDSARIGNGVRVPDGFEYNSANNPEWMTVEELRAWINMNFGQIGNI